MQLALASEAQGGNRSRATDLLRRALVLGEREGHIRVFLDAGPAPDRGAAQRRAGLTRAGSTRAQCSPPAQRSHRGPGSLTEPHRQPRSKAWLDPLSERELDVLRLLDSDLGGPAIARELSVSVNTVRTHTRHIYAKLGVTSRREAVREAARLGLLRHPSR